MTRSGDKMNIMRKVMWVFIACCILKANQAVSRDLYPEQAAAGLFSIVEPSSLPLIDQPDDTTSFTRELKSTNGEIQWFIDNIVNQYGFEENKKQNEWNKQGTFGAALESEPFKNAARNSLDFFKNTFPNWAKTKAKFKADATGKCSDLLAIIAARYLLVIHILFEKSERKLFPCETKNKIVTIPKYVCYPEPYGSATCTSDYDLGLVGPGAGELVEKFNNYFQSQFKKPSDEVLDTNIYAFSLEYAVPKGFFKLPQEFIDSLTKYENTVMFKMQELVSAYYKVFKHNGDFFKQLRTTAKNNLKDTKDFDAWDKKYQMLNGLTSLSGNRVVQNIEYQKLVKTIGETGGYTCAMYNLETLDISHLYAAEAYHTRGAIRHVVGGQQIGLADYATNKLATMDLWTSMIENWGESIKVYNKECGLDAKNNNVILEVCVLKMSKYMWRMLDAMRNLRERIKVYERTVTAPPAVKLVGFFKPKSPDEVMKSWLKKYKKDYDKIPTWENVSQFFNRFDCVGVKNGKPLPFTCLVAINNKVDAYNKALAKMFITQ